MLNTLQRHERRAVSHHSRSPTSPEASEDESDSDKLIWCFCRDGFLQKAHGSMVACDDSECCFEWFHYTCVGITEKPKGKWYCPGCLPKHLVYDGRGFSRV
ncbi:unnamed protein product [Gongylonema pulchrum]|uniref:PHD-type domain-containing protein n=1 Tax=Gongylonema pulchrum TaxID=637853 RepID=A0A183D115_9BILA|nr:unnamed protein product [Gongylonema pulchrum]